MREIGDAAVLLDERRRAFEVGVLGAQRGQVGVRGDAEAEDWPSRAPGSTQFSSTLGRTSKSSFDGASVRFQWSVIASTSKPARP